MSKWIEEERYSKQEWELACEHARFHVLDREYGGGEEERGEVAIVEAEGLLQVAHHLAGVACPKCAGLGRCAYADTSMWVEGPGGMAITEGTCDECWGTGRTDRIGHNLRRLAFGPNMD